MEVPAGGVMVQKPKNLTQYTLPIIQKPDFTSYSYFVSDSNKGAYQLVETWPNWAFKQYVVCGPSGHGKTHLGHILKDLTQGVFFNSGSITSEILINIKANNSYIIDDINAIPDASLLFHFYNLALENKCNVIYLSDKVPSQLDFGIADVNSRFRSLPIIELAQPDDEFCRAIIKKILSDWQVNIMDEVIDYLLVHTSRSLTDIQANLNVLNQQSLIDKRNITIPFIKRVLNVK